MLRCPSAVLLLVIIATGSAGLARFAGGALADDPARRRTIAVGGYSSTALLSALIGLALTVWQVALLLAVGAFGFGNVAITLLILRATQLLQPGYTRTAATQLALGLYVLHNVAATVVSLPAGRVGDTRGNVLVLATGVACFLLAYLGLATGNLGLLALAFIVAGVAIGCVETAEHATVASLAPVELRGSAFGLLATVQSVGTLAASAVAGFLWPASPSYASRRNR